MLTSLTLSLIYFISELSLLLLKPLLLSYSNNFSKDPSLYSEHFCKYTIREILET